MFGEISDKKSLPFLPLAKFPVLCYTYFKNFKNFMFRGTFAPAALCI